VANLSTKAAALAQVGINDGYPTPYKVVRFQHGWAEYQLQVGGVHVGIGQDGPDGGTIGGCQVSEGSGHTGFAGASFAAQND
jgi:hypothetical protein